MNKVESFEDYLSERAQDPPEENEEDFFEDEEDEDPDIFEDEDD